MFAIEELGQRFEQKTNGTLIIIIVLSGLASISLQGNFTFFKYTTVGVIDRKIILSVFVCAVICGILDGIFSRILIEREQNR